MLDEQYARAAAFEWEQACAKASPWVFVKV